MHVLFLILFIFPSWSATTKEVEEAKQSIKTLIRPMVHGPSRSTNTQGFRLDGCEKYTINWSDILLMRKSMVLNYKFKTGCDIQGTVTPKILQVFPVELALRNLSSYNKMESENKITASLEVKPIMLLEMRKGKLIGSKGEIKFEADYQIQINPISDTEPAEKDLGGELRITEIYGSKVNIKEKIKIR